jgi:subtilisin-like proprotein convertase family protein
MVDALSAVRLAETWITVQSKSNLLIQAMSVPITNKQIMNTKEIINKSVFNRNLKLEHVELEVDIDHANIGDLVISVISPGGTESIMMNRVGKKPGSSDIDRGLNNPNKLNFTFSTTHIFSEECNGEWQVKIVDKVGKEIGNINKIDIKFYGAINDINNTYIFTNEASQYYDDTHSVITDHNGVDTINAASVSTSCIINLQENGQSKIAGNTYTMSKGTVIENAFSGDGDNTIIGNDKDNIILGGRGNDNLSGGKGFDILAGGKGNNIFSGGEDADMFVIAKDKGSINTITDFKTTEKGEIINIVGFANVKSFSDLQINQQDNNVNIIFAEQMLIY